MTQHNFLYFWLFILVQFLWFMADFNTTLQDYIFSCQKAPRSKEFEDSCKISGDGTPETPTGSTAPPLPTCLRPCRAHLANMSPGSQCCMVLVVQSTRTTHACKRAHSLRSQSQPESLPHWHQVRRTALGSAARPAVQMRLNALYLTTCIGTRKLAWRKIWYAQGKKRLNNVSRIKVLAPAHMHPSTSQTFTNQSPAQADAKPILHTWHGHTQLLHA